MLSPILLTLFVETGEMLRDEKPPEPVDSVGLVKAIAGLAARMASLFRASRSLTYVYHVDPARMKRMPAPLPLV